SRELKTLGIPWTQAAVFRLEAGERESVAVHELLALAIALGTTPLALITDPRIGHRIPVAAGVQVDPWHGVLWSQGDGHDSERDRRLRVDRDTWIVFDLASAIDDLCRRILRPPEEGTDQDARDRSLLRLLQSSAAQAASLGARPFPVPDAVRARAVELGFDLPAAEG
ncbi:MAG: hypothetical protein ACRDXB_09605, partial [Actinomycetes bacterium]